MHEALDLLRRFFETSNFLCYNLAIVGSFIYKVVDCRVFINIYGKFCVCVRVSGQIFKMESSL